jgi:hypothetical protein
MSRLSIFSLPTTEALPFTFVRGCGDGLAVGVCAEHIVAAKATPTMNINALFL